MRLIDADEVMDILPEENVEARMAVLFAPTVDPVTHETAIDFLLWEGWLQEHDRILTESAVKHGRWITSNYVINNGTKSRAKVYTECKCSVCGGVFGRMSDLFCYRCGAKMDGGKDEID